MERPVAIALTILLFECVGGCGKPDRVETMQSPIPGIFFTEETSFGRGPVDNDYTRFFAHLERDGHSDRKLVLSGEYVTVEKIVWNGPRDATLCMQAGGLTNAFHNLAVLRYGDTQDEQIHFSLQEHC